MHYQLFDKCLKINGSKISPKIINGRPHMTDYESFRGSFIIQRFFTLFNHYESIYLAHATINFYPLIIKLSEKLNLQKAFQTIKIILMLAEIKMQR